TVDVDQLPVEHVLLQQDFLRPALEWLKIEPHGPESRAPMLDRGDRVGRDEYLSAGDCRQDPAHGRILLAEPNDQILDLPELASRRVDQVAADNEREMQERRRLCRGALHCANDTAVVAARVLAGLPGYDGNRRNEGGRPAQYR